jgi:DNA polymerase I-like protein with 3'-5' exonuclease and polymerase domains
MEWNGLAYDVDRSLALGRELEKIIDAIIENLNSIVGIKGINWGSPDQLSRVLYGGPLVIKGREQFPYTYKSGPRKGLTVLKERGTTTVHELRRRIEPLPRTEAAKEGFFSTDEKTLGKLKATDPDTKWLLEGIQELRGLLKRLGTYYYGLPKLYKEMGWENNILHGSLNSCVAVTGRLSSTKPNQQNMDHKIRECIVTRFS